MQYTDKSPASLHTDVRFARTKFCKFTETPVQQSSIDRSLLIAYVWFVNGLVSDRLLPRFFMIVIGRSWDKLWEICDELSPHVIIS